MLMEIITENAVTKLIINEIKPITLFTVFIG